MMADRELWPSGEDNPIDGERLWGYDTDNDEFKRGMEAGKLWIQIAMNPAMFEIKLHRSNLLNVKRMLTSINRVGDEPIQDPEDEDLVTILIHPKGQPPA